MAFYEQGSKRDVVIEPFTCQPATVTFPSAEQENDDNKGDKHLDWMLNWHGHGVRLLSVYGHSDDGLLILIDNQYLFSGDTVLSVSTITRFPGGSKKRYEEEDVPLLQEIIKDFERKEGPVIYPGHCAKMTDFLV